jgi:hypothetical protein
MGTVVAHRPHALTKRACEPFCRTFVAPSRFKRRATSPAVIVMSMTARR